MLKSELNLPCLFRLIVPFPDLSPAEVVIFCQNPAAELCSLIPCNFSPGELGDPHPLPSTLPSCLCRSRLKRCYTEVAERRVLFSEASLVPPALIFRALARGSLLQRQPPPWHSLPRQGGGDTKATLLPP